MIRRPPRSTLFPYRRSSDLVDGAHGTCFAGEEQLFAVMGDSQIRVGPSRNVANNRASLESRSEEHTSELQSRLHLVCRLLLEKKKTLTTRNRANSPHKSHSC